MSQQIEDNQANSSVNELLAQNLDPDAAELLKDLDFDDEEEASEVENFELMRLSNPSLASIITATTSIPLTESVENLELASRVDETEEAVSSEELTRKSEEDLEDALLAGKTIPQMQAVKFPSPEVTQEASEEKTEGVEASELLEEVSPSTIKAPLTIPAAEPPLPAKSSTRNLKLSLEKGAADNGSKPGARKPSAPPPVPPAPLNASPTAPIRVLKENEIAITQEGLSAISAGGMLDEAHDLEKHGFSDNNWYTQIFNDDYMRTIPSDVDRQTKREARFIVDRLGIQEGARMLDLCCGYGRHTLNMAQMGFDMVGLDLSMVMLKKALADAQKSSLSIKFVHGDMQKLSFKSIFDGIYNVQTSFGYFNDQKNFKVLQGILHALKPGGRFFLETINRDFFVDELPMRQFWKGTDCTLFEEVDLDNFLGVLKIKRSFVFSDSSRAPWEQYINIRLYSAAELRGLLMRAGFEIVELSGDYSLPDAFFGASSPRIIFVAERPIR